MTATAALYAPSVDSGTKYLLASVAGAANTANAYRPAVKSTKGVIAVLASAAPTSELPLHAMASQQRATAAFTTAGALRSRRGRLRLAISAASWIGLLGWHRAARDSGDVLERSLVDELGPAYRDA